MNTQTKGIVFLSHSWQDKAIVSQIATQLHLSGVQTWYDIWDMSPGAILPEEIKNGLEACNYF